MKFSITKILTVFFLATLFVFSACDDEYEYYSPKPRGYFRIDFPEKKYKVYDSLCPYSFEIPTYSKVKKASEANTPCSFNLEFPDFKATLYLGYRPVNNNIAVYLDDSHNFAKKHQIKATGLDEIVILRDSAKVYGLLFDIAGNTASSLQFYLTDSTKHFLRGSLYFNSVPNVDSLKIVIEFLKKDVLHLINTTRWKNASTKARII
ncbi:MAG: gliding motility lipoprotein GldD [Bacteroidetes bacterium]|nr:gliding motility lipoprotein GldD [Bacteroidota bacterium]